MRLQLGLLNEVDGPGVNGRSDALKYQCIPLFPDIPASYNKDLHEESAIKIVLGNLQHLKERSSKLPLNSNHLPASSRKRASEEKMYSCLFSLQGT